jgi:hypothetical protein
MNAESYTFVAIQDLEMTVTPGDSVEGLHLLSIQYENCYGETVTVEKRINMLLSLNWRDDLISSLDSYDSASDTVTQFTAANGNCRLIGVEAEYDSALETANLVYLKFLYDQDGCSNIEWGTSDSGNEQYSDNFLTSTSNESGCFVI